VISTSVPPFPVIKRQNERVALVYVCARPLEADIIVVHIISVLSVVDVEAQRRGSCGNGLGLS
jgi:hypothetical protein